MENFFNYVVPVFNKQDILPMTLDGINSCASRNSQIIIVLDGCTDNSEAIVDKFIADTKRNVRKLYMPDVHMLRSVNAGLRCVKFGYTVVMQDDIVLQEPNFEKKITNLYQTMGPRLGVISLRLASNVGLNSFSNKVANLSLRPMIEEIDVIVKQKDIHSQSYALADNDSFYPRMSAINGPNIIPWSVLEKVGLFDEELAPYGFDDPDYCLRAMKVGFINGIYPLNFRSDLEWGGTRRSKSYIKQVKRIHLRNKRYLWQKHKLYLRSLSKKIEYFSQLNPVISLDEIPDFSLKTEMKV